MTDSAYPKLDKAEEIFKLLVWDNLVIVEKAALFADAPYLAVWPIRPVVSGLIDMYSDRFFGRFKQTIDVNVIPFVNDAHRAAFDRAAVTLQVIGTEKGTDSPEFKNARENAKLALSQFVRFGAAL